MRVVSVCLNPAVDVSGAADNIQPLHKIRTDHQQIEAGGGGVNVARVLHRFSVNPELIYLSGGGSGALLDQCVAKTGISSKRFGVNADTRIAFTFHHNQTNQEYRFVPEGPEINSDTIELVLSYIETLKLTKEDIVVASGSLPRGVPSSSYSYIANRTSAKFVLDSSGDGLSAALLNCVPYLVKPSIGELQKLAGTRLDESEAKRFAIGLVQAGRAENIVVSMGSHGAFLANRDGVTVQPAHYVKVCSAVGAGDSFVAGIVYSIYMGNPIEVAFKFGVAAGAAAVMTVGSSLCRPDDVNRLFTNVY